MNTARVLPVFAALTVFVSCALAQVDEATFRAKFGQPLARQTFKIPAGEMVVDYAANGHVCRIQLPPVAPDNRQPGMKSAAAMDEFALKLVPLSLRGKELQRLSMANGRISMVTTEYENVTLFEPREGDRRTSVSIQFKRENCQPLPVN
jgi:hypothetical protein